MTRSTVTIDLAAVAANVARLRHANGGELWAVVKADGYGHGAVAVAGAALWAGATGVGVATATEAEAVRLALPDARILVLSPVAPEALGACEGLEVVLSTSEAVAPVLASAVARVHVKVDTGMGRWGLGAGEGLDVARRLAREGRLAGVMSHLATSEDADPTFVEHQVRRFAAFAAEAPACPRHLANSGGVLYHPGTSFDGARCGLALYGISPRDDDPAADGLVPALVWQSVVRATRVLAPGESTGYARAFVAGGETRIAHVPVGYADGFPRRAAGRASVVIGGTRCPVVAVAMDQLAVVAPVARVGDVVTLVGEDGSESATISGLARAAGTIGYEVACGLLARPTRTERRVVGAA